MHQYDNATTATLNRLLRGELSAVETYDQVIESHEMILFAMDLFRIRTEHEDAVESLTSQIHEWGGEAMEDSGLWGTFARAVEGTAQYLGRKAMLLALREGEEYGSKLYENAIMDPLFHPQCKILIGADLLPRQHAHVSHLNRIIDAAVVY